jgi:hypothetical protein
VEVDRLVPLSGNLWIGGQQVWLGPALAGCAVTIRVDESALYVVLDGMQLKTLPSRLGVAELGRLAAHGARPAGPLPAQTSAVSEVVRMVNRVGLVSLEGAQLSVGLGLAGQRVTLLMDGPQMAVISHEGELVRTMACPVAPDRRHLLRGPRRVASSPPRRAARRDGGTGGGSSPCQPGPAAACGW